MPLYGRKVFHQSKPLVDVDPNETIYTIPHTQEQFRSKAEYEKRLSMYEDPVWTCQCTGHINLTHEEAYTSEQEKKRLLKQNFPEYFNKTVLSLVHHSTEQLDTLVDKTWTKIQEAFVIDEVIALKVKANGKILKGKVVHVDTSDAEKQNGNKSCNSPSSDKENTSGTQEESGSPKKWVPPKLLPYKYNIRLEEEGKIISSIPVQDLQRTQRTPSKELVKLFVRANALRTGNNQAGPWVVDEELVAKYQLPSKFADFFLSVHKMAEAGKKSTEINHKKRKLSDAQGEPPAKKPRGRKSVDKKETKQKKVSLGKNTPSKSVSPKKKVASPKKKDTPKSTPQKVITIDSDESDSDSDSDDDEDDDDDEMTLAQIQRSPSKTGTPRKSSSGTSSKQSTPKKRSPKKAIDKVKQGKKKQEKKAKEKQQDNPSPRKRGRPRKEEQVVKSPGKRGRPRKTDTPKKESPKKGAKSPGKQGKQSPTKKTGTPKQKNLKQMTLFDMKKGGKSPKKGNKPASPTKIPKVVVNMEKAMKDGDKTLIKQLSKKAARDLSAQQRNKLPPGKIRDLIMQSFEALEDRKKMKSMTAEQKEEYLRQRKAEKKRQQALERRRANKKVEDTVLDLQPLPTPKLVPTPDGIVNEMFGEVAMVTEFLSCFKGLLMPDDDCPIVADALMKALGADAEGFSYLNHTLGILLQTLLQDGIAEDYKELTMPVSSIAVNPHTVSELVRLVLRKHDSGEDHDDASSDNSDELLQEEEVPEDLVELLETTELFKLDPQQKLQILSGLCHRIMGSYSVQGYMETKQHEAGQLWKQKIAELKEAKQKREVEKKENKEKKKEQKGKKSDKEDEESTEAKPQGVTLLNFYSKENADSTDENQVHDEDLASIVKRRRVMAAKAAAEKEQKEKEDKIRREKEAEEWRKEKEKESFEKAFNEGLLAAKLALRHQSIGTDRNHSRYWIFNNAVPGLYVEKGWAHKDMTYTNRKPGESSDSSDSDFSDSDDEPLVQKKKMGRPKKNKDEEEELTFPHSGQNLWFMYDTVKELDQLMESLHTQGIRESALKGELSKQHVALTKAMSVVKKANNESNPSNGEKEVVEGFRSELLDIETRLRNGGLGGVDEFQGWEQRLQKATTIEEFGQCLIETQSFIMNKFCLGMMMKKKIKVKATEVKEETEEEKTEDGEEQVKKEDEENGTEVTVKEEEEELEEDEEEEEEEEEEDEDTSENFVAPMVAKWKEAIQNCQTFSRLHVLMSIMDACIKWEKSAENAKCKVCRKKGDDAKLLLCDECNQAFHLYCLRPSLLEVPRGDWFCPACVPTTRRLRGRTDYRKMADYSSSEEDSDESIQHEDECAVCGGDEGLIFCNSCPSAFHLDCHEPPLRHQPRSTWSCVQCKTGVRIRSKRKALEAKSRTRRRVYEEDDDWTNKPQPRKARPPPSLRSSPPQQASRTSQSSRRTSQTTMAVNGVADHQKESPVLGNRSTRRQMSNVGSVFAGGLESVTADKRSRSSDRADANRLKHELQVALDIIQRLNKNRYSWPFRQPVDAEEVPDYYQVVKNPIDLMTIRHKCQSGQYSGVEEFLSDMALMFDNAFLYNKAESEIGVIAAQFEKAFIEQLNRYVPGREYSRLVQTTSAVLDDHAYCTASKSDSSMEM